MFCWPCITVWFNNTHQLDTLHIHFHFIKTQSNHCPWTVYVYNSTLHPPKLCSCSASWGWASDARNMSRIWVLIKWKWLWSVSSWCVFLNCNVFVTELNCISHKCHLTQNEAWASGVPRNFFRGGSTNSVDRRQREQGSGDGSPLVRGSAQFVNGWNSYSY
jgi:hypothetical protein